MKIRYIILVAVLSFGLLCSCAESETDKRDRIERSYIRNVSSLTCYNYINILGLEMLKTMDGLPNGSFIASFTGGDILSDANLLFALAGLSTDVEYELIEITGTNTAIYLNKYTKKYEPFSFNGNKLIIGNDAEHINNISFSMSGLTSINVFQCL